MLTDAIPGGTDRAALSQPALHDPRLRTLTRAWRPCARGLPLPTLAATAVLAGAPSLVVALRQGRSYDGALVAAALAVGAATAFAVEDPAEETLGASPTPLAHRRLLRLAAVALGAAVMSALLLLVAAFSTPGGLTGGDVGRRAAEMAATSGLAGAGAGLAQRRGAPWAAHGGAAGGVLVTLLISGLAYRYTELPALIQSPHHSRWWGLGLAGWLVVGWTWRDPARR